MICWHPEVAMEKELPGWRYWCTKCRKTISVPQTTLLSATECDIAGILGIAFGPSWGEKMRWEAEKVSGKKCDRVYA